MLEARRGAPARARRWWPTGAMKSALVAAGSPGPPSKLLTLTEAGVGGVTCRPAAVSVVVPEMSRSRQSIAVEIPPSRPTSDRVVEKDRGVRARRRRRLGEGVREGGVVGRDLRLDRVALGLGIDVLAGDARGVEVEKDGAGDAPFEEVVAAQAGDQVVAAAADQGVVAGVADDGIVVRAAQHVGDPERVGQGQGQRARDHGLGPGLAEIDRDPGGRAGEIEPGDVARARRLDDRLAAARAAVEGERVVAAAADQRVVARAANQGVGAARADQGVVAGPALKEGAAREARGVEGEVAGAGRQDRVLEAADRGDRRGQAAARGREASCW